MTKYGFTGTRSGMTSPQMETLRKFIIDNRDDIEAVHHGDCVGADREFHDLVRRVAPRVKIIVHPPLISKLRAFCRGDETREQKPYLVRNKNIIAETDTLLAAPCTEIEIKRSGTWSTIRHARKADQRHIIFWPNGSIDTSRYVEYE